MLPGQIAVTFATTYLLDWDLFRMGKKSQWKVNRKTRRCNSGQLQRTTVNLGWQSSSSTTEPISGISASQYIEMLHKCNHQELLFAEKNCRFTYWARCSYTGSEIVSDIVQASMITMILNKYIIFLVPSQITILWVLIVLGQCCDLLKFLLHHVAAKNAGLRKGFEVAQNSLQNYHASYSHRFRITIELDNHDWIS